VILELAFIFVKFESKFVDFPQEELIIYKQLMKGVSIDLGSYLNILSDVVNMKRNRNSVQCDTRSEISFLTVGSYLQ
jgi:hypothetical protein